MKILPTDFDGQSIRRVYDEGTETWWFSVIDVVQVLTDSNNANRYWSDLKRKLAQEAGSDQPYEKIVRLKLTAPDGKKRETDCATAETLLRLVQSIRRLGAVDADVGHHALGGKMLSDEVADQGD